MSEDFDAGKVAGRMEVVKFITENLSVIAECSHVNEAGNTIFMAGKFLMKLDGTWVEPVAPEEPPIE